MNITQIIEKNKNAIVLLDLQKPGDGNQKQISIRGTGFIISSDGSLITCAHVYKTIPDSEKKYLGVSVPGQIDGKVMSYDRFPVSLVSLDEENDIALMKINFNKKFETIEGVGDSETVEEGSEIAYIGYPLATELLSMGFGITMTTNRCIISSVKRRGADLSLHFFLVDTHTNNGSSGSPVFSIEDGKVIGIVSGKISAKVHGATGQIFDVPANIGICRPIKYAVDLINKNK